MKAFWETLDEEEDAPAAKKRRLNGKTPCEGGGAAR